MARPRALILAAGLGTRLAPLTDGVPKPLLPVCGRPILAHTLKLLAAAGFEAAAVNLHHHGDAIRRALGDELDGLPIRWSQEPRLRGTLGALGPLEDFAAGADPLVVVNGDSLCRWPLAALLRRHRETGALATLLLAGRPDPAEFGGGVATRRDGRLAACRRAAAGAAAAGGAPDPGPRLRWRVFAGAHVLSPRLVARIAASGVAAGPGPSDFVRDLYEPLLAELPGCLATLVTGRHWHDLGTPRRFLDASLEWAVASGRRGHGGHRGAAGALRSWISKAARVAPDARLERASVEAGCWVGAGAVVRDSVLLTGARVGAGCVVGGSILGPGAELAAGGGLDAQLLAAPPFDAVALPL